MILSIFKLGGWRSGAELKEVDKTWMDTFDVTQFHDWHIIVMKNMNLLYEYYDARHDFVAQRRK